MKRQLYPLPRSPWEAMQFPSISGHSPNVPPEEAGGDRGELRVAQPPDLALDCQGRYPPSSLPFPHPGKPGLRGQMGQSCLGLRNSPAPPSSSSISGPFMAIGSGRAAARVAFHPAGSCQAGGRDTGGVTQGCPRGSSPPACHGTAAFWGHHIWYTAKFTLCLLPCPGIDGLRDTPKYLTRVLGTPQGPSGGIVAQKAPPLHHEAWLNTPAWFWGEVLGSWWAPEMGWVEEGENHPKLSPPSPV